jgi:hypothetical protein
VASAFALSLTCTTAGAQTIPSDPKEDPVCIVTQQEFNGWFASGSPSVNGVVNPADSIAFQPNNNCDFYKWSEQMFMWLTSPAPSSYGGTGPVFNSNVFYQIVTDPKTGQLIFLDNPSLTNLKFNLRAAQAGPNGLPVILDSKNVLHEIKPTPRSKSGKQMIAGPGGKLVEIASAKFVKGQPVLLDAKGKQIKPQLKALLGQPNGQPSFLQQIIVSGKPVFFDENGFPIIPDQGQAGDGGVLVGQSQQPINGSLVYYATFTNDVFAYFLTMVKNGPSGPPGSSVHFPTKQTELDAIVAYAKAHGTTFPDPNALAMEVKTSWVQASNPDPSKYVLINAAVPVYQIGTDGKIWKFSGSYKPATLALVGIHVVGSLTNHPEMAWSTFELFGNAPNATYQYLNSQNQTVQVQQNTSGSWFFCQSGCQSPFNSMLAKYQSPNIVAATSAPIGPSNTLRQKAFGAAYGTAPNAGVTSDAQSNSEVITINNTVLNQILNGDVRKNYYLVGSTWTASGAPPNGAYSPQYPSNTEIGTSQLQNTTMETYQQGVSNTWSPTTNCFGCHNNGSHPESNKTTVQVSHIWNNLTPLFPPSH